MRNVLIAGLVGGVAMFIWAALAHTVLPLGEAGIKTFGDNDAAAVASLKSATGDASGVYAFPGAGLNGGALPASGPTGLVVYNAGVVQMNPPTLGGELALEIVQSVIAAFLLSLTALTIYWKRVGFVVLTGVAVALSTSLSYAIWYAFPLGYTAGYILTDLVRYLVAGLVIAWLLKPRPATA